uniref:Uncharacterized protein n=1 Tax=Trypanosoma vivax (strain Y486) TaxID=1055687 RepID=G0TRT4_TRYVY|nr:conserved hypothetical protein, in T. vivax [Trypanosoma vivax Y486]
MPIHSSLVSVCECEHVCICTPAGRAQYLLAGFVGPLTAWYSSCLTKLSTITSCDSSVPIHSLFMPLYFAWSYNFITAPSVGVSRDEVPVSSKQRQSRELNPLAGRNAVLFLKIISHSKRLSLSLSLYLYHTHTHTCT